VRGKSMAHLRQNGKFGAESWYHPGDEPTGVSNTFAS
jgi:hypothetical protein